MGTALQPAPQPTPPPQSATPHSVKMNTESGIRQNYHEECEAFVNKQINLELHASYVYTAMCCYFHRDDQALPGFARFFRKSSDVERNHGLALMEYQTKRGGKVVLQDITKPTTMEWGTPLEAMAAALEMEKTVNTTMLNLHAKAWEMKDFHLADFIRRVFLVEQVETIKQIGDYLTTIRRVGNAEGIYMLNKDLINIKWVMDNTWFTDRRWWTENERAYFMDKEQVMLKRVVNDQRFPVTEKYLA